MKIKLLFITLLGALSTLSATAQESVYDSPLRIPILLSSNFAEMRTNHFHSGIDIKTAGREGLPVYAVADGYISRINISPYGYGRALYITHPNGTMSVYAHLQSFGDEIEERVRQYRYRNHKFSVDIYPTEGEYPVVKGEQIALSGNSGNSYGAHLHFEIRQTSNSATLNTITLGHIKAEDKVPPTIAGVHYIEIDTLNGVAVRRDAERLNLKQESPIEIGDNGYFVVETTDRKTGTTNRYGPYKVEMRVDGCEYVVFAKDKFLFSDTRCCNITAHYPMQRGSKNEMLAMALHEGNRVDMYRKCENRGVVSTVKGETRSIDIVVTDDAGNTSSVSFEVVGRGKGEFSTPQGKVVSNREDWSYSFSGTSITIPQGALYEPIYYSQRVINPPTKVRADSIRPLSKIHSMGSRDIPLDKTVNISIAIPEGISTHNLCIASVDEKGNMGYVGGRYADGKVSCKVRSFGHYCIARDTTAPTIKASFKNGADLTAAKSVSFTLADNFSGVNDYSATLDGNWAILEYHPVKRTATLHFDSEIMSPEREHKIIFTATDGVGNSTTSEYTFVK